MSYEEAVLDLAEAASPGGSGWTSRTHHASIRRYLIAVIRSSNLKVKDVDDIVDEALTRFVTVAATGQIDSNGRPDLYLKRIAYNLAVDTIRRQRTAGSPLPLEEEPSDPSAEVDLRAIEEFSLLVLLLEKFRTIGDVPAQRVLNELANSIDGHEETVRSLAERTALSPSTVHRALRRVRGMTRRLLEQDGPQ